MLSTTQSILDTSLELNRPNIGPFAQHQRPRAKTAAIWFAELFPEASKQHGAAFVEIRESYNDGAHTVTPFSINHDFFAAALAGDARLGHRVIYFEPEMQFYYREPVLQLYKPTTEQKLQCLYRALMMRCAQELPNENNKLNLCVEFRSDKHAKLVTQRAKSILAADQSFFSATSPNARIRGIELHERIARKFVEELLTCEPGQTLLLADAHAAFCRILKERELAPLKRSEFKSIVIPLIKEEFDVALRNDLVVDERQGVRGWKNVKLLDQTLPG